MRFFLIFLLLFWGMERFCHDKTDGFKMTNIFSDLPTKEGVEPPTAEILPLLSGPFTFLGSGAQAYAFVSADGKTVLKLFKHHHLRSFPSSVKKREKFFLSCALAAETLGEETGILYAHLIKSRSLNTKTTLIDKLGIAHPLDLDSVEFVLQKRACLALSFIKEQVKGGKQVEAKEAISAVIEMLAHRCKKGVRDRDGGMRRNIGYLPEERAISIDIGFFVKDEALRDPQKAKAEIRKQTWRLERFLKKTDPYLLDHYNAQIEAL